MEPGEIFVLIVSQNKLQAVIRREFDNLTREEIIKYAKLVNEAKLEELKRWQSLDCFKRMLRKDAKNKVDGTWVLKWKKVRKEVNGKRTWVRIIKARLTARGFKDAQAFEENIKTYSGTASKWSQRAVNAHAAQMQYTLFSMDISAAFLKGMTYKKIAEVTGEPLRTVQFDFPANDAWLLRQLPGMEDYDNNLEILDLIKAMWGLKDAPRAFGMRLKVTLKECGYVQGIMDPQVWRKFKPGTPEASSEMVMGEWLLSMLTTHIDDIKGSATEKECEILLAALKKDYGDDAKIEKTSFEHTGIQHVQDENKSTVYTHQNHYVKDLSEIPTSHLDMKDLDKEVDTDTHALYWSLLGGIAWLLQTRADICPFVGFLQRAAQKPLIRHVRLINRVLRYVRRVPSGILFRRLEHPVRLVVVADAAYKAQPNAQECLALRGYIILLVGSNETASKHP